MKLAALLFCACLATAPALAHKVIAGAYVAGDAIEGEIGFSSGAMAEDTVIEVFDANGNRLGETVTDETGFFVWTVTARVEHVFRADLGSGHVAEIRVPAEDIGALAATDLAAPTAETRATAEAAPAPAASPETVTEAQAAMIAEIVRAEMRPLRREIAAYREATDLQKILGGIGYILGLFGVGYYVAARRRMKAG